MISKEEVKNRITDFTLGLYDIKHFPKNAVQTLVENVQALISNTIVPFLKEEVYNEIKNECSKNVCGAVNIIFEESRFLFKDLSTEHLRIQKYKKERNFVEPEKIEIGLERVFVIMDYYEIKVTTVPRYIVYVPMKYSIKNLLEKPTVYDKIQSYIQKLSEEKQEVSNVLQGVLWKKKYSHKEDTFPLFLFIDEWEPGNALGSHSGKQKLTGVYLSLPFLPPNKVKK